jgi:hypothetical protein
MQPLPLHLMGPIMTVPRHRAVTQDAKITEQFVAEAFVGEVMHMHPHAGTRFEAAVLAAFPDLPEFLLPLRLPFR